MKLTITAALFVGALVPAALAGSALAGAAPRAQTPEEGTDVEIVDVTPRGSGCPVGTAHVSLPSANRFQVTYDGFDVVLEQGPNADIKEKFCQLLITLKVPAGRQISITEAVYHGSMTVGAGTTAQLRTLYYFAQNPDDQSDDQVDVHTLADSPSVEKDWTITSSATGRAWSRCGGTYYFNAKGRLTLSSTGYHGSSHLAMQGTDSTVFTYEMQGCDEPTPEPTDEPTPEPTTGS